MESEKTYGFLTACFLGIETNPSIGESFEGIQEISFIPYFSSLSSFLPDSPFPSVQKTNGLSLKVEEKQEILSICPILRRKVL